ncbi:MAG: hypothetical protein IPG77_19280 [Betaproteobacteria bacterium]|nr:hypothetical protein [Betaproteobacteria bacterium]
MASALQGPPLAPEAAATLEQARTAAVAGALTWRTCDRGRIDHGRCMLRSRLPRQIGFDAAAALCAALAAGDLEQAERQAVPRPPLYGKPAPGLAEQRALVDHEAWRQALPPLCRERRAAGP